MHVVVLAHNIRSAHNVGSIFRTCEGFGVEKLYLSGYTPVPNNPSEPPHIRKKITDQIHKTALDAERLVPSNYVASITELIEIYKNKGYIIAGLEQTDTAIALPDFEPKSKKILLILGEEVHGIEQAVLNLCDATLEIPMVGKKESFNVSVAAGIALYQLTLHDTQK